MRRSPGGSAEADGLARGAPGDLFRPPSGWWLGLDVATTTGWAKIHPDEGLLDWGEVDFSPVKTGKHEPDEPEGVRFVRAADWIAGGILDDVEAVVLEQTYSNRFRTAQILFGLAAVMLVEIERRGLEYAFVPAATLKKHAIHGKASKEEMLAALHERYPDVLGGLDIGPDAVDALWAATYGLDVLDPKNEAHPARRT